jgi:hypothetical protein
MGRDESNLIFGDFNGNIYQPANNFMIFAGYLRLAMDLAIKNGGFPWLCYFT